MHGSHIVGIEGWVNNERLHHRNTGAKMVMDGCMNGDCVDEVRVRHAWQVGYDVVLNCVIWECFCCAGVRKKNRH